MNDNKTTIEEIKTDVKRFIDERDWEQFHNPKDVAIALSVEAAEVLEHFTFKSQEQVKEILADPKKKEAIQDELGDCIAYLTDLARVCDIDLAKAYEEKIKKTAKKYPIDLVKGKNNKYTDYKENSP